MRFDSYAIEMMHARKLEESLRKACDRNYLIRRIADARIHREFDELRVRLVVFVHSEGATLSLCIDRSGYGTITNFGELTDVEMRRVATIKETYQQWIDGKLDELPKWMPWEKELPTSEYDEPR